MSSNCSVRPDQERIRFSCDGKEIKSRKKGQDGRNGLLQGKAMNASPQQRQNSKNSSARKVFRNEHAIAERRKGSSPQLQQPSLIDAMRASLGPEPESPQVVEEVNLSPSPKFGGIPLLQTPVNPAASTPNKQESSSSISQKSVPQPSPKNAGSALPPPPLSPQRLAKKKYDTSTVLQQHR